MKYLKRQYIEFYGSKQHEYCRDWFGVVPTTKKERRLLKKLKYSVVNDYGEIDDEILISKLRKKNRLFEAVYSTKERPAEFGDGTVIVCYSTPSNEEVLLLTATPRKRGMMKREIKRKDGVNYNVPRYIHTRA